ncbi:F0F1 ATP synthase subunit A [Nitrosomonas sp. Nm132]|jgi:F-type H+-transporting ATPase subunit a|uniref:F0F1 ATP synthase subunit A n=1 Tax=Nitrosomonas sp. Nm132 TaxID=1881053 RepID=UPI00088D8D07|nr:F0F1 ATP synthase subunit A [Nitrosomonas sp. Nm132]SDH03013.1 F-type H+-transporting ATPase subunit a [Nitrosomonas sp. Nm132]
MASDLELTPTSYITHHLTNLTKSVGEEPFWTLHVDTLVMSVILGVLGMGFLWLIVRRATPGVPTKRQAFVELLVEFVDFEVKNTFHGNRHTFIAPAALTIFVWVLLLNMMDFLPIDIMAWIYEHVFGLHNWRSVPTTDVNTTFALALSIWLLMIFFNIQVKGLGGWMHELFCTPFGKNPILWPLNLLFNLIEYVSKPLSHSLRLFGNIYAGEIIFLLLGMWAATGVTGSFFSVILSVGWLIFHILIVALQAFIFMMLAVVYLSMAHESH